MHEEIDSGFSLLRITGLGASLGGGVADVVDRLFTGNDLLGGLGSIPGKSSVGPESELISKWLTIKLTNLQNLIHNARSV